MGCYYCSFQRELNLFGFPMKNNMNYNNYVLIRTQFNGRESCKGRPQ